MTSIDLETLEATTNDRGLDADAAPPLADSFLIAQSEGTSPAAEPVPVDAGAGQPAAEAPVAAAPGALQVDEDGLSEAIIDSGRPGEVDFGGQTTAAIDLASVVRVGGEAAASYRFTESAEAGLDALGLTHEQIAITHQLAGETITGSAGGQTIYTITLNPAGGLSVRLLDGVDHTGAPANLETNLAIDLSGVVEAVGEDGTAVSPLPGTVVVNVGDDIGHAPEALVEEYVPDADNVVRLPEGVSIDNIKVEGVDLVLQQADGTIIIIRNAASDVPTFIIGNVEIPRVALLAALESSGVEVAFGADGSIIVGGATAPQSSGNNFSQPPGDIGDGFPLTSLLPPTALQFERLEPRELHPALREPEEPNTPPLAGNFTARVSEEGLAGGNPDNEGSDDQTNATSFSGTLPFSDPDGDPLTFTFGQPALQLTSGGLPVLWSGVGTGQLTGSVNGVPVITVTANANGTYSVVISGPIDHPNDARPGQEDDLTLIIPVTASDGQGGTATGNMAVVIEDDSPIATAGTSSGTVDEDGVPGGIAGGTGDLAGTATVANGSVAGLFQSGADAPLTYGFAANTVAVLQALGLTSGSVALGYAVVGNTVTASVPAGNVFTFTVDPTTGAWTFTLIDQLDHPSLDGQAGDDTENDLLINLGAIVQVTDADGDTVTGNAGSLVITVDDDVPGQNAATVNINVDEDELTGLSTGITDNDAVTTVASFTGAQLAGLVDAGADEPVKVTFNQLVDGVDTGLDSKGENILYDVISPTQVNGVAGGRTVFTLVQTAGADLQLGTADDVFTFTLLDQVDHTPNNAGGGDGETIVLSLAGVFVATDFDGDSIVIDAGATVTIENDVPIPVLPEHAVLSNQAGGPIDFDLDPDNSLADNVGADEPGTVRFPASLDGSPSGMFSNSVPIIFVVSGGGLVLQGFADETLVFTIMLNPVDGTYSVDMDAPVDSVTTIDFNAGGYNFVGGNGEWAGFTSAVENSPDLLLTPQIGGVFDGTINANANEGGVGGGNSVGSDGGLPETFRVDYVTDLSGDPGSTGQGDYDTPSKRDHVFDGHYNTNGASAEFTATSGSTVNIAAYNDSDADGSVVGPGLDSERIILTAVLISYGSASLLIDLTVTSGTNSYTIGGRTFTVTEYANGSIDIGGVFADNNNSTNIAVFSDVPGYNALEYTWVSGDTFKIGDFGASVPSTDPVDFQVPIEVVDFDGDTAPSTLSVTLTAAGEGIQDLSSDPDGVIASSTDAQPHIIGSDFADTLTGDAEINVLSGGAGDDFLIGNGGNDVLIGGTGSDTMTGGAGSDTFVIDTDSLGGAINDFIVDFQSGATGDVIDLTSLLNGLAGVSDLSAGGYVQIAQDGGIQANAVVSVDTNGGGDNFEAVAVLQNFTYVANTVQILFDDGSGTPKTDTV